MNEQHIRHLVSTIAKGMQKLDALQPVNGDEQSIKRMQAQAEQIKTEMLGCGVEIAVGFLSDIARIANALETIAKPNASLVNLPNEKTEHNLTVDFKDT